MLIIMWLADDFIILRIFFQPMTVGPLSCKDPLPLTLSLKMGGHWNLAKFPFKVF